MRDFKINSGSQLVQKSHTPSANKKPSSYLNESSLTFFEDLICHLQHRKGLGSISAKGQTELLVIKGFVVATHTCYRSLEVDLKTKFTEMRMEAVS